MRKLMFAVAVLSMSTSFASARAQEADGPIVTAAPAESPEALRIREAAAYAYDLPKGAPSEDYPFVAWCEALVKGHIALGETLTNADALDLEIMRLGRLEAADFRGALDAGEARQTASTIAQANSAASAATAQWQPLLAQADEKVRSQAFGLFFGLPGRCEHAARRVREGIITPPATLEDVGAE